MTYLFKKFQCDRFLYFLSKDSKRFAGHSKWMNIKHTKEEKDNQRMILFHQLTSQMKVAIKGIYLLYFFCFYTKYKI